MDYQDLHYFIIHLFSIGVVLRMLNTLLFHFPLCQHVSLVWSCPPRVAEVPTSATQWPSQSKLEISNEEPDRLLPSSYRFLAASLLLAPSSTKHLHLGLALSMSPCPFFVWLLAFLLPADGILQNVLTFKYLKVTIEVGLFGSELCLCIFWRAHYRTHQLTRLV